MLESVNALFILLSAVIVAKMIVVFHFFSLHACMGFIEVHIGTVSIPDTTVCTALKCVV